MYHQDKLMIKRRTLARDAEDPQHDIVRLRINGRRIKHLIWIVYFDANATCRGHSSTCQVFFRFSSYIY